MVGTHQSKSCKYTSQTCNITVLNIQTSIQIKLTKMSIKRYILPVAEKEEGLVLVRFTLNSVNKTKLKLITIFYLSYQ